MTALKLPDWPRVYYGPNGTGRIRVAPEDFIVEEQLAFEPSGEGEHVFLHLQKISENTEFIARLIARFAGVRQRDIGYAGLKDRHAVTSQWFSVWLPGKEAPDWAGLESDQLKVLQVIRHARKLKRGVLAANHFKLRIRDWQGDSVKVDEQLQTIRQQGIPNYFGSQRFGNNAQNLQKALALFQGAKFKPEQRSIYLSAARAYLFNQVLAERIQQKSWQQGLAGDCFMFAGSKAFFQSNDLDQHICNRLHAGEIHPTGPLWGLGDPEVTGEAFAFETAALTAFSEWREGLEQQKLAMTRRALRVIPGNLQWQWLTPESLELSFSLPPGSFATALLRELLDDQ